jgi:hypothetical protein
MMNYPFPTSSPYIQAAMTQAVQALMSGGQLPPNCVFMAMPLQQVQQMLPQLMMNPALVGRDQMMYSQPTPYYGQLPYTNNHVPSPPQNYNYPVVPYKTSSKNKSSQPHSNIYNSTSFDSYMEHLSWSRIFDRPHRKNSKPQNAEQALGNTSKKSRSNSSSSSSSSSSTTSDETIRRVNVSTKQSSNGNSKQQTKGSLPFKYSSEFVPGVGKQQASQKIKSNDVFIIKKP